MAEEDDKANEERRIAQVMEIAESLSGEDVYDGYARIGLATSGTLRFKWTAQRLEDGRFVVHETVGGGAVPVTSRPMPKEEVLNYIDARQVQLRGKIEDIKRELATVQGTLPEQNREPVAEDGHARDPLAVYDEIRRLLRDSK